MLLLQQFLSLAVAWPQNSLVAQMVLESEENTSEWKDNSDRGSSRTETTNCIEGTGWGNYYLKHVKTVRNVCVRRFQLRKVLLPYIVRNVPLRSRMELQSELWARLYADTPMNCSSGVSMIWYISCNHESCSQSLNQLNRTKKQWMWWSVVWQTWLCQN